MTFLLCDIDQAIKNIYNKVGIVDMGGYAYKEKNIILV